MLAALTIKNLAIVQQLQLNLEPGFTVLTGETGAGKSILVDALSLILGGRASADFIRTGADDAEVEALFDLSAQPESRRLAEAGFIEPGGHELIVRRLLARSGKNRAWINGRMETTARLTELGRALIDIYGQHEHQDLLRPEHHRVMLDAFADLAGPLDAYQKAYHHWRRLSDELSALDLSERSKRERMDLLRFRLTEIQSARLEPDEDLRLLAERELLRHAETLKGAGEDSAAFLYESENAAAGGLRGIIARLREAAVHDPWFVGPADQVEQAVALIEDAALDIRKRTDRIESDPERLAGIEDRLHEIKRLKRKYGDSVAEVMAAGEDAERELAGLLRIEERREELSEEVQAARSRAREDAGALTRARGQAGADLARRVETELASLGMDKTRFEVRVTETAEGLTLVGADEVGFYLSPNPGEDLKPLERIASGGELSRIMLALRVLPADEQGAGSLVFDEVDAGIGGAVAESVGRRMQSLARSHQVFCVTHLPQIASLADHHFLVVKRQAHDRTSVEVELLSNERRVEELARMLGGRNITDTTRAHAREMLTAASQAPAERGPSSPKSDRAKKSSRPGAAS